MLPATAVNHPPPLSKAVKWIYSGHHAHSCLPLAGSFVFTQLNKIYLHLHKLQPPPQKKSSHQPPCPLSLCWNKEDALAKNIQGIHQIVFASGVKNRGDKCLFLNVQMRVSDRSVQQQRRGLRRHQEKPAIIKFIIKFTPSLGMVWMGCQHLINDSILHSRIAGNALSAF